MIVFVEYFAQARDVAGCPREAVELAGTATLIDLVKVLATRHGPRMAALLLGPDGGVSRQVILTVGDVHVLSGQGVVLSDGDRVTVVPPISGG